MYRDMSNIACILTFAYTVRPPAACGGHGRGKPPSVLTWVGGDEQRARRGGGFRG